MPEVLVTGGAGYIGSHMCVELLQAGYDVVVVDNLSNSSSKSLSRVQDIARKPLHLVVVDIRDDHAMGSLFDEHEITAVLHFAGLKAVGESVADPIGYYDNNVGGSLCLLRAMRNANVKTLVFSSSATVYGMPEKTPIDEAAPTIPINPYGRTKLHIEEILKDVHASDPEWRVSVLRYFNPVGAHASGDIGENPRGIPNNLLPYLSQVAVGKLPQLKVFGGDYPTPDGTGIRDYIHVVDLVRAHLRALEFLQTRPGFTIHNLGTGTGYSVLEVLKAYEAACGKRLPYEIVGRRPGDAPESYADPTKANRELDWRAEFDIKRMCIDTWRWQSRHPHGYD